MSVEFRVLSVNLCSPSRSHARVSVGVNMRRCSEMSVADSRESDSSRSLRMEKPIAFPAVAQLPFNLQVIVGDLRVLS